MIGVGIVGAGWFAGRHVAAMAAIPDLRLVAVAAGHAEATAQFVSAHGGRGCGDWREVVADPDVDVVLVATPHHLHAPAAIAALQAGKHVLVEKPMAPTLAECRAMAAAEAASGKRMLVGHIMRFARPCLAAREVIDGGALGRPRFGLSRFIKRWMEPNRRPWHLARESGGGMLLTAGIHALDRLLWLMDAPAQTVSGAAATLFHDQAVADTDALLLRFGGGGIGLLASVGARDATMINETEIACENGTLLLDVDGGVRIGQGNRWTDVAGAMEPDWMLRALEREWAAMRACVRDGAAPPVGAAEGMDVIACIEAAHRSAASGRAEAPH